MNTFLVLRKSMLACLTLFILVLPERTLAQHPRASEQTIPGEIYLRMMDTMMEKMDNAPSGGTAAVEFTRQMIPHHEGAVAMAYYEIIHGKNRVMVQLAKSILAEQTIEIQQMNLWLEDTPVGLPVEFSTSMSSAMKVMMDNLPAPQKLNDIDRAFASVMKPHHQAGIDMARALLACPSNTNLTAFAKHIIAYQQIEIEQMQSFLKNKQ